MRQRHLLITTLAIVLAACGAPVGDEAPDTGGEAGEAGESTATSRALEELSAAYEELSGLVDRDPGEAVEWAESDLENLGDFEYRIVEIPDGDAGAIEAELNALGDERWEVFWVQPVDGAATRYYLKRSSISYLSRLPLSAMLRLFGGGGGGGQ